MELNALQQLALMISSGIALCGLIIAIVGIYRLAKSKTCTPIEGEIVNIFQEYTSRGFLWKAKVAYTFNGRECFHITKARTTERGTGKITLYITEKGKVIEKNNAIAMICGGFLAVIMSFVLFFLVC